MTDPRTQHGRSPRIVHAADLRKGDTVLTTLRQLTVVAIKPTSRGWLRITWTDGRFTSDSEVTPGFELRRM